MQSQKYSHNRRLLSIIKFYLHKTNWWLNLILIIVNEIFICGDFYEDKGISRTDTKYRIQYAKIESKRSAVTLYTFGLHCPLSCTSSTSDDRVVLRVIEKWLTANCFSDKSMSVSSTIAALSIWLQCNCRSTDFPH